MDRPSLRMPDNGDNHAVTHDVNLGVTPCLLAILLRM